MEQKLRQISVKEIVINECFGGFNFSPKGRDLYEELSGLRIYTFKSSEVYSKEVMISSVDDILRDDRHLLQVVKQLGPEASGKTSNLVIYQVPSNYYEIDEYDGAETVILCTEYLLSKVRNLAYLSVENVTDDMKIQSIKDAFAEADIVDKHWSDLCFKKK